jgi:hypothetical protein
LNTNNLSFETGIAQWATDGTTWLTLKGNNWMIVERTRRPPICNGVFVTLDSTDKKNCIKDITDANLECHWELTITYGTTDPNALCSWTFEELVVLTKEAELLAIQLGDTNGQN